MKIDPAKIKSWVERVERLLEERAGINGDIKDIFAEVKSGDHDAKAIRKLIQRRAQDPGDLAEQDTLLAAYTDAVAGKIKALVAIERGASTKEAAKAGGISTGAVSSLARVQKSRKLNGHHDLETGEIETDESASAVVASLTDSPVKAGASLLPSSAPVAASGNEDLGVAAGAGPFGSQERESHDGSTAVRNEGGDHDGGPVMDPGVEVARVAPPAEPSERPALQEVGQPDCDSAAVGGDETVAPPEPDLAIPAFLDQRKRQVHA